MSENEAQNAPAPVNPALSQPDETITASERQWIVVSLGSALVLAIILLGVYRLS